jgi:glycosyltransferase involved in cell wall biosynthesis
MRASIFTTLANPQVRFGRRRSQAKLIKRSGLFFPEWYVQKLRSPLPLWMKPIEHYLLVGAAQGLDPNPLFSSEYYGHNYPEAKSEEENPLLHFLIFGHSRRYNPHWLFDTEWYLRKNPDVVADGQNALTHYIRHGAAERRDPSPLFDTSFYLSQMAGAGISNCLVHFLEVGVGKHLKPNRIFDGLFYVEHYPDVAQAGVDPLLHYIATGAREGRDPGEMFQSNWYLDKYPDVRAAHVNPLIHFLSAGASEGRQPCNPDVALAGMRIAVVAHVFYREMWRQIVQYLRNIPVPYELFVTVPEGAEALTLAGIRRTHPQANIVVSPNRGWDVAPFLQVLSEQRLSERFDVVCKLHTKKGRTYPDLWRKMMLDSTLGNQLMVTELLLEFRRQPDLIIAGASDFFISGPKFIGPNGPMVAAIAEGYRPGVKHPSEWGFFAGTMFWMRPAAYERFTKVLQEFRGWETDTGKNDGEFAHAAERAFGLIASLDNKRIGQIKVQDAKGLGYSLEISQAPGRAGQQELADFLRSMAKELDSPPVNTDFATTSSQRIRSWKPPEGSRLGLNVVGPIYYVNGLAVHLRGYIHALQSAGVKTFFLPWTQGFERLVQIPLELTSDVDRQPANLVHLNLDLLSAGQFLEREPLSSFVNAESYNVLSLAWEFLSLPEAWVDIIDTFDEVWVASSFVARAVAAVSRRPVRVVPPPIDFDSLDRASADRVHFGLPIDRFIFFYSLDAGSVLGRKNPHAFVRAFCETFTEHDGAMCVIKIHSLDPDSPFAAELRQIAEERQDFRVITEVLDKDELATLYHSVDCYVSPHRSEGLGLTIIEAMAVGKPVIVTNFGGVVDFIDEDTAFPLPYKLIEVGEGNAPYPRSYTWADPNFDALKRTMLRIFDDRASACAVGFKASQFVRDRFSVDRARKEVRRALEEIWQPGSGNLLEYDYLEQ